MTEMWRIEGPAKETHPMNIHATHLTMRLLLDLQNP
jgi:hypothetical protein